MVTNRIARRLAGVTTALIVAQGLSPAALRAADKAEGKKEAAAMPVVAQHKYRMLAKVRPLLFWISKDDVGGARISWRGDETGGFGVDLLIGSDPLRAPRKVNRWGYIAEQVQGTDAHVIGVMKQSDEESVAEAEARLAKEGAGGFTYRAIRGTADSREARAGVTTVRVERDLTFRDIDPLLSMIGASTQAGESRTVALPGGTRPGFLVALHDLVAQSVEAYSKETGGAFKPSRTPTRYVYYGVFYDLTMKSATLLKTAAIDGHQYTNVARGDFEIKNSGTGETTRFQLTYGTSGALAGIPIHAVYQPKWWFEVQLFLDDKTAF
jgi:hypothetical protein